MVKTRAIWLPLWFRILAGFTSRPLDCSAMSAGYMVGSNPCTASPIGFIAKSKGTHARIRVLRSQNRVQRRAGSRPVSASKERATVESV
jgi:hypothetical protein